MIITSARPRLCSRWWIEWVCEAGVIRPSPRHLTVLISMNKTLTHTQQHTLPVSASHPLLRCLKTVPRSQCEQVLLMLWGQKSMYSPSLWGQNAPKSPLSKSLDFRVKTWFKVRVRFKSPGNECRPMCPNVMKTWLCVHDTLALCWMGDNTLLFNHTPCSSVNSFSHFS